MLRAHTPPQVCQWPRLKAKQSFCVSSPLSHSLSLSLHPPLSIPPSLFCSLNYCPQRWNPTNLFFFFRRRRSDRSSPHQPSSFYPQMVACFLQGKTSTLWIHDNSCIFANIFSFLQNREIFFFVPLPPTLQC